MLYEKIQLEDGEVVLKTVRKHWFVIVAELFGVATMIALPFFLIVFLLLFPGLSVNLSQLGDYLPLVIFGTAFWLLLSLLTGFMLWTHYFLDLWVITDRRIIVIDQIRFFDRKVASFRLERLQEIKVSISGLIQTFLNFGTLRAQTASASESSFETSGLPDPRGLQAIIQQAMDQRLKTLHLQSEQRRAG